jgi:hypothetical protein
MVHYPQTLYVFGTPCPVAKYRFHKQKRIKTWMIMTSVESKRDYGVEVTKEDKEFRQTQEDPSQCKAN